MALKPIDWLDQRGVDPENVPANVKVQMPLAVLYEELKKRKRAWAYRYGMDRDLKVVVSLRVYANNAKAGENPTFLGAVSLDRGRDSNTCYAIRSNRISLLRRVSYRSDIHTKLVSINNVPRAIATIQEYFYTKTTEEIVSDELVAIHKQQESLLKAIAVSIEKLRQEFTGLKTLVSYEYLEASIDVKRAIIMDIFSPDATLELLRAKYEEARVKGLELAEITTRRKRLVCMLDKSYRVTHEGDVWLVRLVQGSSVGTANIHNKFEDMPERLRNGVVALRMLGEGLHEGVGVNLNNGEVFWIYEAE